jgi:uncharacterized membrane protein
MYHQLSLNIRKQMLEVIGVCIFVFCIVKTYCQKASDPSQPLDFIWLGLGLFYIYRGLRATNTIKQIKLVDLTDYPTKVMFVVYSINIAVIIAFAYIYHNYYQESIITSPFDKP